MVLENCQIAYVQPTSGSMDWEKIQSQENPFDYLTKLAEKRHGLNPEDIHAYRTIEDFVVAYNNGYISDEGYLFVNKQIKDFNI